MDFPGEKLIARIIGANTLKTRFRTLKILSIYCRDTTESGEDEVYLKIIVDGKTFRYPKSGTRSMNEDSKIARWTVNRVYRYQRSCRVEIWDDDSSSKDDHIGSITATPNTKSGKTTTRFRKGSKYDITVELSR